MSATAVNPKCAKCGREIDGAGMIYAGSKFIYHPVCAPDYRASPPVPAISEEMDVTFVRKVLGENGFLSVYSIQGQIDDAAMTVARALLARLDAAERREERREPTVKPLEWRDHGPDSFPAPVWQANTPFGFYTIEEESASDSPRYRVEWHSFKFVADEESLDEAKAAAQQDFEQRIRAALEAK